MTDYFNEFPSIVGNNKNLPSPADTPYETSNFIRSKRSSRATTESFHEDSHSANSLAPSSAEHHDNGRFNNVDPRRFTPTLHASLVSEILNLRRELDSKNHLVENLETNFSNTKSENETLHKVVAERDKELRKSKQQVKEIEEVTYGAFADLAKERDEAKATVDELRAKLENSQKKTRHQDEDAVRAQTIYEDEKQRWDNERRQLERRIHVTDTRLRTLVDQIAAQQSSTEARPAQTEDYPDNSTFKDSGLGNESDTASIITSSPARHRRNKSSLNGFSANIRGSMASRASMTSPDLHAKPMGNSLADELGIDEEDEYDVDEYENEDEDIEYTERVKGDGEMDQALVSTTDSPESSVVAQDASQKQPLSSSSIVKSQQSAASIVNTSSEQHKVKEAPRVIYVDKGYQPSPPSSPALLAQKAINTEYVHRMSGEDGIIPSSARENTFSNIQLSISHEGLDDSPISPPQTPEVGDPDWPPVELSHSTPSTYVSVSTQTELIEQKQVSTAPTARDSLSPPAFVPSIAIHPPSSRPSTPRPSVLPPGTRNASTQADLPWPSRDASVQTEEIRVDRRPVKLPPHLLPGYLLPSPKLPESRRSTRASLGPALAEIVTKLPLDDAARSPPAAVSPIQSSPEEPRRDHNIKDSRSMPLKAIPLPRPVLSPITHAEKTVGNGPLNRSSQYGVVQPRKERYYLVDRRNSSDGSDLENLLKDAAFKSENGSTSAPSRPPQGRFGLSEPPKAVPEHKEISPDRRPRTADSYVGAPAPSIANFRTSKGTQNYSRPSQKHRSSKESRSRSPSLRSVASSNNSSSFLAQCPPYPIPNRSSSRAMSNTHSEGSRSPTRESGNRSGRSGKGNLRKVQSANAMRSKSAKTSPTKPVRRRRRSPELTPVVSMAFDESPAPTKFPIPDLPTPLQGSGAKHSVQNSVDTGKPSTVSSTAPPAPEEINLVDAVAATMVGEWMWKYIRKRKSFGLGEDNAKYPVDSDGVVDVTGHGNRHKRWVWLSPYERTIMWDSKQPTTGSALLGKKGRKLTIQSVLEVKDNTPLPKDAELSSAFNRSILICTPQRALRFTTITQERHNLWMTALSFLAQSEQPPTQLSPVPYPAHMPMPPSVESVTIKRHRSPSFARGTIRDSIRLAKGKRPDHFDQSNTSREKVSSGLGVIDSADAPSIPRLYISTIKHSRKRSNTSPRVVQNLGNLRSFSSSVVPSSASSTVHPDAASSSVNGGSSSRPTLVSTNTSPTIPMPNFFEAVSTMRMEAFVDPNVRDGVLYVPAPPPGTAISGPTIRTHNNNHHHHTMSQTTIDRRRGGYVFDEDGLDPFRGF